MKCLFTLLFLLLAFTNLTIAQESEKEFKKTPFKYSENDIPFSIGFGPSSGIGNQGPSIGINLDCDIFHVLISGRLMLYGFPATEAINGAEKAILVGYQYRRSKYMISAGYGIGTLKYMCKEGSHSYCNNFVYETRLSNALKLEFDWAWTPYICVGIGFNSSFNERSTMNAVMAGIKFGVFRNNDVR
ncbi:MAG: hypothetical protein IPP71_08155 [Bacteroidetes bacterium]|nr:hypothetical protein [Bacteroidota bacterium]